MTAYTCLVFSLIQLMVNCWFWGLVVWIFGISRKWKGLGYLGVSRFESQNHRPTNQQLTISSHRIHGTGIFTYVWLIFLANVGKYTSAMDPMGLNDWHHFHIVFVAARPFTLGGQLCDSWRVLCHGHRRFRNVGHVVVVDGWGGRMSPRCQSNS